MIKTFLCAEADAYLKERGIQAAMRTGQIVTFDEQRQEVLAGGKVFQY